MLIAAKPSGSFACVLIVLGMRLCQPVLSQLCYPREVMADKREGCGNVSFSGLSMPWEEKWHEIV